VVCTVVAVHGKKTSAQFSEIRASNDSIIQFRDILNFFKFALTKKQSGQKR
jgi:hypothetical protein